MTNVRKRSTSPAGLAGGHRGEDVVLSRRKLTPEDPRRRSMAITLEVFENPIILFGASQCSAFMPAVSVPHGRQPSSSRRLLRCTRLSLLGRQPPAPHQHQGPTVKLDNRAVNPRRESRSAGRRAPRVRPGWHRRQGHRATTSGTPTRAGRPRTPPGEHRPNQPRRAGWPDPEPRRRALSTRWFKEPASDPSPPIRLSLAPARGPGPQP